MLSKFKNYVYQYWRLINLPFLPTAPMYSDNRYEQSFVIVSITVCCGSSDIGQVAGMDFGPEFGSRVWTAHHIGNVFIFRYVYFVMCIFFVFMYVLYWPVSGQRNRLVAIAMWNRENKKNSVWRSDWLIGIQTKTGVSNGTTEMKQLISFFVCYQNKTNGCWYMLPTEQVVVLSFFLFRLLLRQFCLSCFGGCGFTVSEISSVKFFTWMKTCGFSSFFLFFLIWNMCLACIVLGIWWPVTCETIFYFIYNKRKSYSSVLLTVDLVISQCFGSLQILFLQLNTLNATQLVLQWMHSSINRLQQKRPKHVRKKIT